MSEQTHADPNKQTQRTSHEVGAVAAHGAVAASEQSRGQVALETMIAVAQPTASVETRWRGGYGLEGPGKSFHSAELASQGVAQIGEMYEHGMLSEQPSTELLVAYALEEGDGAGGYKPVVIDNPTTGRQEQAASVFYLLGARGKGYGPEAPYVDQHGRPGNHLYMQAEVPYSVADDFVAAARDNPAVAREFARRTYNAVVGRPDAQGWSNESGQELQGITPPYDRMGEGRQLSLVTFDPDFNAQIKNVPVAPVS